MALLMKLVFLMQIIFFPFTVTHVSGVPLTFLECQITPKDSTLKVNYFSQESMEDLEKRFSRPLSSLVESVAEEAERLDVRAMTGAHPDSVDRAVVISESLDGSEHLLAAPITIDKGALHTLKTTDHAFIQIVLPGKFNEHEHVTHSSNENAGNSTLATMTYTEPTPSEAVRSFMERFLKLDPEDGNTFIPESVRYALSASEQVIIHPTAYLQTPDTETTAAHQLYAVTSATPLHVIFGLFTRVE